MNVVSAPPTDTITSRVWVTLPPELKQRTLQFLAQLAFNRAAAQTGWFPQEVDHVQSAQQSQNPS